jgi:hypothetical protein
MLTRVEMISVFFLFADIKKSRMSLFRGSGSHASAAASSSSELIYPPSSGSSSSYFFAADPGYSEPGYVP